MKRILFTLAAAVTMAQVTQPFAGYIVDRNQALRPVLGIAGNFVLGDPIADSVLSAASSGRVALAKTNDEVWTLIAGRVVERRPAPPGMASFTFDQNGSPSTALFAQAKFLWRWTEGGIVVEVAEQPDKGLTDEIELPGNKHRVRLAAVPSHIESMGPGWLVAYLDSGIFAVRTRDGAIYQIPEPGE